jgi:hypothetical protein
MLLRSPRDAGMPLRSPQSLWPTSIRKLYWPCSLATLARKKHDPQIWNALKVSVGGD